MINSNRQLLYVNNPEDFFRNATTKEQYDNNVYEPKTCDMVYDCEHGFVYMYQRVTASLIKIADVFVIFKNATVKDKSIHMHQGMSFINLYLFLAFIKQYDIKYDVSVVSNTSFRQGNSQFIVTFTSDIDLYKVILYCSK